MNHSDSATLVKVYFRLAQDSDQYPPVAVESVWAKPGSDPLEFIIENTPFFAREATLGDTVLVRIDEGGHWFETILRRSGNSLVRVVFLNLDDVDRINADLVNLGCWTEYSAEHALLAISIPLSTRLSDVQDYLRCEANGGGLDYEEPILRQ